MKGRTEERSDDTSTSEAQNNTEKELPDPAKDMADA
jgi:hypothetical protein